jgi:hypothetical protein
MLRWASWRISRRHYTQIAQHSHSCVRISQVVIRRKWRPVYLLAPNYVCSPETLNLISLSLSDDHKAAWKAFRHDATGFLRNVKAIHFRKLVEDLITYYEKLLCNIHSRCISSLHTWIPFWLTVVRKWRTRWAFTLGHLSDEEQIQGQMECYHVSRLLLDGKEGCSGNSVRATSENVSRLIHISLLLCPASMQ